MYFMTSLDSAEYNRLPINKEEYLKEMICVFIGKLEFALKIPASELKIKHLKVLKDASKRYQDYNQKIKKGEEVELNFCDIGGHEIYQEMSVEMREWIYIYEPLDIRKAKQCPENKLESGCEHIYLADIYDAMTGFLNRMSIGMKRKVPKLMDDQISLAMCRDYLKKGSFEKPEVKPEVLLERYEKIFKQYKAYTEDLYEKLGMFRSRVNLISLYDIHSLGVQGLREEWRDVLFLMERVHIEFIGVPGKEKSLFRSNFMKKLKECFSDGHVSDEERFYQYIKAINEMICKLLQSPKYGDSPEMMVALDLYLHPEL